MIQMKKSLILNILYGQLWANQYLLMRFICILFILLGFDYERIFSVISLPHSSLLQGYLRHSFSLGGVYQLDSIAPLFLCLQYLGVCDAHLLHKLYSVL